MVRHAQATVLWSRRRTGMIGSWATLSSIKMKSRRNIPESGRVVRTSGWVHGTKLPPELRPSKSRTSVKTNVVAPRKSTRLIREIFFSLTGILTVKQTSVPDMAIRGSWMRKAHLQPQLSFYD